MSEQFYQTFFKTWDGVSEISQECMLSAVHTLGHVRRRTYEDGAPAHGVYDNEVDQAREVYIHGLKMLTMNRSWVDKGTSVEPWAQKVWGTYKSASLITTWC